MQPAPTPVLHGDSAKSLVWVSLLCGAKPTPKPQHSEWTLILQSCCWLLAGVPPIFELFCRDAISPPHCRILGFWRDAAALEHPPGFLYSERSHLLGGPKPFLAFTSCLPEVGGGGLWRLRGIEVRLGKTVLMIHRIIHKRSVCERLICLLIELSFKFSFIKLYKFGLLWAEVQA